MKIGIKWIIFQIINIFIIIIFSIIVIIILAAITYFSSLNTVDQAQLAKKKAEFKDVCTFVRQISTRAEAGMLDLDMTGAAKATDSQIATMSSDDANSEFTSSEAQKVQSYNNSGRNAKFNYYYVTGKQIMNDTIPGLEGLTSTADNFTIPNQVDNDYIINFYYGVVIAKVSPTVSLIEGAIR